MNANMHLVIIINMYMVRYLKLNNALRPVYSEFRYSPDKINYKMVIVKNKILKVVVVSNKLFITNTSLYNVHCEDCGVTWFMV